MSEIARHLGQQSAAPRYGRPSLGATITAILVRLYDTLWTWQRRAEGRRQLMQLDDRLLKDIGIDRLDALQEADKPFWRP